MLTLSLTLLTLTLTLAAAADGHRTPGKPGIRPKWMTPFAWAVAVCETGKGNRHPDYQHRSGSYGGAWGWYIGTWRTDAPRGFPRLPWQATARQQYAVFLTGMQRGRYWGCIAGGGYRSWL